MERGKSFIGEMFNFVKTFTPEKKKAFWKKHFTQITAKTAWLISAIIIATNFLVQIILSQFSLINIINILTLVWLFWIAILFVLKKIFKKEYLMNKAK